MSMIVLLTLLLQGPVPDADAPRRDPVEPGIEWTALPPDLPQTFRDSLRFGYLSVPQDHGRPDGARMRMAFAVLPARSATPAPDPVVFITGGPGSAGIGPHLQARLRGPHPLDIYRDRRDLIVFDQRGNGYSEPQVCPDLPRTSGPPRDSADGERLWLGSLAGCRDRLVAQGVRLETLSAVQVAHDLEYLRRALGAPQLNLVGHSYGARLAAEAVRQHPLSIRAAYYASPSVVGRDPATHVTHASAAAEEALGALFRACARDERCRTAYPRLEADYESLIARVRAEPLRGQVQASTPADGELLIDDHLLQRGLSMLVDNRTLVAGVPLLIHTLATRGLGLARDLTAPLLDLSAGAAVAPDTHLAFVCNDGRVGPTAEPLWRERCRMLLGDAYSEAGAEPVHSRVPALIETGEFDARTPPSFARLLAEGMPGAHVIIGRGHGHDWPPDCVFRISRQFFETPDQRPDTACLDSIPPVAFVTNVVPSRWVGRAAASTWQRPWLVALPGAAAILMLVPAVGLPVREVRRRRRRQSGGWGMPTFGPVLLAVVGLMLLAGLAGGLLAGGRQHAFIPLIGLPAGWIWVLPLPWLLLVLTPAVAFLMTSGRSADDARPPATRLSWSALLGAALLVLLWAVLMLP
jgi:pimeloyl-ACP methyl ester carboxylesterase